MASPQGGPAAGRPPRIPQSWAGVPEQRLYALAILFASQAFKIADAVASWLQPIDPNAPEVLNSVFHSLARSLSSRWFSWITPLLFGKAARTASVAYLIKWALLDSVLVIAVRWLRIPGLTYGPGKATILFAMAVLFNSFLFGSFDVTGYALTLIGSAWRLLINPQGKILTLSGKWLTPADLVSESHLSGGKVVQLLPYGTAVLNPLASTYCIPPFSGEKAYIPLITNSSNPVLVEYYIQSLEDPSERDYRTLSRGALESAKESDLKSRRHGPRSILDLEDEDDDELSYRLERDPSTESLSIKGSIRSGNKLQSLPKRLERSQKVYYLAIDRPGLVQVVKIEDEDEAQFRLRASEPVLVAECPSKGVLWLEDRKPADKVRKGKKVEEESRCTGQSDLVEMLVQGVGSMKVDWTVTERGTKQTDYGTIEGIESTVVASQALVKHEGHAQLQRYHASTYTPAQPHTVSLPITHDKAGVFDVHLHTITDSLNNELKPEDVMSRRIFHVHQRPSISFSNGCTQSNPLKMLKGGGVALPILYGERDADDKTLAVRIAFRPHGSSDLPSWEKEIKIPTIKRTHNYEVRQPGMYSILAVAGESCEGKVLEPSVCSVEELPVPFAAVEWNPLAECAGDIGVLAELSVTGTPPFEVYYETRKKGFRSLTQKWRFDGAKAEFPLTPRDEGDYTWTITELSDANYKRIPIKAEPFHQIVHPSANVTITNIKKGNQATIWTCAQDSTTIDFDLSGTGPFEVEYIVAWGTGSESFTLHYTSSGSYHLVVPVPQALQAADVGQGHFSVTFISIKDSKACVTRPRRASVGFEVRTTHDRDAVLSLVEGGSLDLPLRLAGEGDWSVGYIFTPANGRGKPKKQTVTVRSANGEIRAAQEGEYRLVSVSDQHCPGTIWDDRNSLIVRTVARPEARLDLEGLEIISDKKRSYRRASLCAGEEDQVSVIFSGNRPFSMRFKHTHEAGKHSSSSEDLHMRSAQDVGILHMSSGVGEHTYTEAGVGDSIYGLSAKTSAGSPAFSLQQTVHARPSASLHKRGALQYCQGDYLLSPQSGGSALVRMTGEAPFDLELEVGIQGAKHPFSYKISGIKKAEWDVAIPEFQFAAMGTYTIRIKTISDASSCPHDLGDYETTYISADAIEQPSILPASEAKDLCVGDKLDFVLQGTAPWSISYEWENKRHVEHTSDSRFTRLAEAPGSFDITSVSHGKAKCRTAVSGLSRRIHALPSARIAGDSNKAKKLHQGDDTPIHFALAGEPPFTFTYTRSLASGSKKALTVVDTQTVSGVMDHTYTIFATQEGVYNVVFVADSFCSYPRTPPVPELPRKLLTNG